MSEGLRAATVDNGGDENDVAGLCVDRPASDDGQRVRRQALHQTRRPRRPDVWVQTDPDDERAERTDTKMLKVLVEVDAGPTLPFGLRVDAFIERSPALSPPSIR